MKTSFKNSIKEWTFSLTLLLVNHTLVLKISNSSSMSQKGICPLLEARVKLLILLKLLTLLRIWQSMSHSSQPRYKRLLNCFLNKETAERVLTITALKTEIEVDFWAIRDQRQKKNLLNRVFKSTMYLCKITPLRSRDLWPFQADFLTEGTPLTSINHLLCTKK
jgi:hypothetical protein